MKKLKLLEFRKNLEKIKDVGGCYLLGYRVWFCWTLENLSQIRYSYEVYGLILCWNNILRFLLFTVRT